MSKGIDHLLTTLDLLSNGDTSDFWVRKGVDHAVENMRKRLGFKSVISKFVGTVFSRALGDLITGETSSPWDYLLDLAAKPIKLLFALSATPTGYSVIRVDPDKSDPFDKAYLDAVKTVTNQRDAIVRRLQKWWPWEKFRLEWNAKVRSMSETQMKKIIQEILVAKQAEKGMFEKLKQCKSQQEAETLIQQIVAPVSTLRKEADSFATKHLPPIPHPANRNSWIHMSPDALDVHNQFNAKVFSFRDQIAAYNGSYTASDMRDLLTVSTNGAITNLDGQSLEITPDRVIFIKESINELKRHFEFILIALEVYWLAKKTKAIRDAGYKWTPSLQISLLKQKLLSLRTQQSQRTRFHCGEVNCPCRHRTVKGRCWKGKWYCSTTCTLGHSDPKHTCGQRCGGSQCQGHSSKTHRCK